MDVAHSIFAVVDKSDGDRTGVLRTIGMLTSVLEDRFEVGLSFGGIPERLVVPFSAIKSFFDPSVQFGLQFETSEAAADEPAPKLPAAPAPAVPASAPAADGTSRWVKPTPNIPEQPT